MGISLWNFLRVFRPSRSHAMLVVHGPGEFCIDVVGESRYQNVIESIAGGRTKESCQEFRDARLVPENTNRYDPDAVQVMIAKQVCGYLSRPAAEEYRRRYQQRIVHCKAMIVGGWDRGPDDCGHFGVKLDLPYTDE